METEEIDTSQINFESDDSKWDSDFRSVELDGDCNKSEDKRFT